MDEAISEVQRELEVRRRIYRRWIDDGKLTAVDARDRLERMEAAEHYLQDFELRIQEDAAAARVREQDAAAAHAWEFRVGAAAAADAHTQGAGSIPQGASPVVSPVLGT